MFCFRRAAQRAVERERREKHKQLEEEREKVRQKLREKYNLEKPESVEEPEEESEESSSSEEEEEEEESIDEEKIARDAAREKIASRDRFFSYVTDDCTKVTPFILGKMAIVVSSLVTGLFSVYLVVSFVHLKIKASVSNMRYK